MITMQTMMETLCRFDLHYPEASKLAQLELLAHDYVREFRMVSDEVWEEAISQALRVCRYFPTIADLVLAIEKASLVVRDRRPALQEMQAEKTDAQNAANREQVRALLRKLVGGSGELSVGGSGSAQGGLG